MVKELPVYTVVPLMKHDFNLVVPYFCSVPEAQEQRGAWLWFKVHQPNSDGFKMGVPLPPNLLYPCASKVYGAVRLCPEKSVFPFLLVHNLMDLGA